VTLSDIIGQKVTLNCKIHLFLAIIYKICSTYIDTFLLIMALSRHYVRNTSQCV